MQKTIAVLVFAFAAGCVTAPTAPETTVELARFAGPTFIENLTITPDGALFVTNYTGKSVHLVRRDAEPCAFASLSVHPVSILPMNDGFLVAAHAIPFTAGPNFIGSGVLLTLDRQGRVIGTTQAPEAGFLNGMVALPDGAVLIADSVKAQILRYEPATRALSVWYADPVLAPVTAPSFRPGANGLKLRDGAVIVSSSATASLYKIDVDGDGKPAGRLSTIVSALPGADDFVVLPEGGFIVATHGPRIVRVSVNGDVSTLTDGPRVLGSTAIGLIGAGERRRAVILGTGGFSEGGKADAVVLSAPAPVLGR